MSYEIEEIKSFKEVITHFQDSPADSENLVLVGVGGWHGSHRSLDDCERILKNQDSVWTSQGAYATIFILNPKEVIVRWGEVRLKTLSEVNWLRTKVKETIDVIGITQEENK